MFRIKSKKDNKTGKEKEKKSEKSYDERVSELAYSTIRDALQTILKTEVKKTNNDGKEVVDCGLTVSKIKMTARLALDFADNLKSGNKKEQDLNGENR